MNAIKKVIEILGSQVALAGLIGVTPQAVYKWVKSGVTPTDRCLDVSNAVHGRVTPFELRPDKFPQLLEDRSAA
jgi:DNA-binding transcriptional regulator YdaS (Cro superfamily)